MQQFFADVQSASMQHFNQSLKFRHFWISNHPPEVQIQALLLFEITAKSITGLLSWRKGQHSRNLSWGLAFPIHLSDHYLVLLPLTTSSLKCCLKHLEFSESLSKHCLSPQRVVFQCKPSYPLSQAKLGFSPYASLQALQLFELLETMSHLINVILPCPFRQRKFHWMRPMDLPLS